MSKASALIYTREKYIGFPGGWFKVQPEDFSEKTAKLVMEYAMSAMEDVKPLRSAHKQLHAVIAEDGYVVLGIAAYLRDLFSDGWEGTDERNRPIYGFFGYVWKQNEFCQPCCFPELKEFASLVSEHIRPNWEISKNAHWATHQELVPYRYLPCIIKNELITGFSPHQVESVENAERLVQWAIHKAANGENVSACTNVTIYDVKDYKTPYQYVARVSSGSKYTPNYNGETTVVVETPKVEKQEKSSTARIPEYKEVCSHSKAETKFETGKVAAVSLLAFGVVLLILALVSLPMAWMADLLWKVLLVVAIACIAAGIVRLMKIRKPQACDTVIDPASIYQQKQPSSPIDADVFKNGSNVVKEPTKPVVKSNQKTARAKKPEEETTEDLFKF